MECRLGFSTSCIDQWLYGPKLHLFGCDDGVFTGPNMVVDSIVKNKTAGSSDPLSCGSLWHPIFIPHEGPSDVSAFVSLDPSFGKTQNRILSRKRSFFFGLKLSQAISTLSTHHAIYFTPISALSDRPFCLPKGGSLSLFHHRHWFGRH